MQKLWNRFSKFWAKFNNYNNNFNFNNFDEFLTFKFGLCLWNSSSGVIWAVRPPSSVCNLSVVWVGLCPSVCDQVRVGRLSFAVGSVQFARRRSLYTLLTILPVVIVVTAAAAVIIILCVCCLQQRVTGRRRKLSPTRTEYNVNYVHISEPSLQSDVSGTVAVQSPSGIHLPQTSKFSLTPCPWNVRTLLTFINNLDTLSYIVTVF